METQTHGYLYFVKVLHLFPVCQPGLHVGGSLDDESLVVCKHLREAVGKNLAELHVQFVVPQLQLLTRQLPILLLCEGAGDGHLLHGHARSLGQGLQAGNRLVAFQQLIHVEGIAGDVPVPLVVHQVTKNQVLQFGGTVTAMQVPFWRDPKLQENLGDFLDKLQLVGELRELLWQFDEMVIDVYKAQVCLKHKQKFQNGPSALNWSLCDIPFSPRVLPDRRVSAHMQDTLAVLSSL